MEYNNFELSEDIFNYEIIRRLTLHLWPIDFKSKNRMASAGFYYNFRDDHLKCKFCKVVIGDWRRGDDPFVEHRIHSPNCPLINQRLTHNIPISQKSFNHELQLLNHNRDVRHPEYKDYAARIKSFEKWPANVRQRPEELSKAGFFYLNEEDQVKCFSCGGCLQDWNETDVPLNEHYNLFQQCKFIRKTAGEAEKSFLLIQSNYM